VHAKKFCLFGGAQLQAWDDVDDLGDDGGHDEGVRRGGDNGSDLPAEGDVASVKETARQASVDTIEPDDFAGSEEAVKDETDHAADTVFSEDVEAVVDANEELD